MSSDEAQAGRIVEAARQMFLASGYAGTSMDAIATRCHVSKRTLYRLFPGKAQLFAAIIEAHRHTMLALPGNYSHLSLTMALEAIFRVDMDEQADAERVAFLRLAMLEARQVPELHSLLRERGGDASRVLLTRWLESERRRGRINVDNPHDVARILMDMIFGTIAFKMDDDPSWRGGARKDYRRRCIRVFVNGVRARRRRRGSVDALKRT